MTSCMVLNMEKSEANRSIFSRCFLMRLHRQLAWIFTLLVMSLLQEQAASPKSFVSTGISVPYLTNL
jgi:hypothetical protein